MKIVNRGFLAVKAKQPFIDWANTFEDEFVLDTETEPNIYLVEEDFFDVEPVILSNFKKIFLNELSSITEEESEYPPVDMEHFENWFSVEAGTSIFDCQKTDLISE